MGVYLGGRAGIQQRMHVDLAHVAGAQIAISLTDETSGSAGVVGCLRSQGGGRHNVVGSHTYTCRGQQQNCSTEPFTTHLSSGAEGPRSGVMLSVSSRGRHAAPVDSSELTFFL